LQKALLLAIKSGNLSAVHDISDGGLAITLAEMSMFGDKGAEVSIESFSGSKHEILFSEAQSGVVVSCNPDNVEKVLTHFMKADIPAFEIGTVSGSELNINGILSIQLSAMSQKYEDAIPEAMKG
jgi:phosphoribosylformylglycinamidine synthase